MAWVDVVGVFMKKISWRRIFSKVSASTLFSTMGVLYPIIEALAFFIESWKDSLQSLWSLLAVVVISVIYTLWRRCIVKGKYAKINGTDIGVEILVSDIFTIEADYVISTNNSFDTEVSDVLISSKSLQGAFTKKYYDKCEHLDREVELALENEPVINERVSRVSGKTKQYNIGTTIKVKPRERTVYLVAVSELNEHGVAQSSFEYVKASLASLWNFVSSRGEFNKIAIPILGTGHGRISTPRSEVVMEIIKSFVAACSERKFTSQLTIVISPKDYVENELDIDDLGDFLKHTCRYAEIVPSRNGLGTAVD